jgi:uncharacterized integral membrane protein
MIMMRFFTLLLVLLLFFLALVFMLQNRDQAITLTLGPWTSDPLAAVYVMLGVFFVGVVFTSLVGIIEGMKLRAGNARLKRKVKKLQAEVDALRNLPLAGDEDEQVSLPRGVEEDGVL